MAFIIVQNVWLGLVAALIVAVQAAVIPRLRIPILRLGRQRQLTARQLAGRVAEIVEGAVEIHANDTSNFERADLTARLGRIFHIRFEIFQRKFFVKFLNNFLAQVTPFIFYAGGGILAIRGQLDVGALIAVIAAYKDLPGPIKELIDWEQRRNDVQIKYEQVIEQFTPGALLDPALQDPDARDDVSLVGDIVVSALTVLDETGEPLLRSISFTAGSGEHVAVIGPGNSGKDHLTMALARLLTPTSGTVWINGHDLYGLPEAVSGRRIGFVAQDVYLFPLSVRDNILYSLRHRPVRPPQRDARAAAQRTAWIKEALRAGNPPFDIEADWTDYAAAGATGPEDIDDRIIEILSLVDLEDDVFRFGLDLTVDTERHPNIAEAILKARAALPARLAKDDAKSLIVRFDPERYNPNASLAENLLFGTPRKPGYAPTALADNPLMRDVLEQTGLVDTILDMGVSIARTMVEIFADLPPGHPFFEQYSFIEADELPTYRALVNKIEKQGLETLDEEERRALMRLPFNYVEARHRLGLIDEALQQRVVAARTMLAEQVARKDPGAVAFYRPDVYDEAASLQDNILFGRIAYGHARAEEIVLRAMTEVLDDLGLRRIVVIAGLDHYVGVGGKRLSAAQRQKIGLARALIKRPDVLVVNDALAVMDALAQARILVRVLKHCTDKGVIWALQRPDACAHFDRIVVMRDKRIVEQGRFAELNKPGSALNKMIAAE
ncbi:MAG: ABC transporter ATP-binding protein [Alphaproteobacteria bacterium]|nr:MAG: ABC transporter ATP-binding protein [Alphaproteobacteria bacterium]